MKRIYSLLSILFALSVWLPAQVFADDRVTQTFTLQPGWNAIYLMVDPSDGDESTTEDAAPANVFDSILGLDRVWAWFESDSSVQFVEDADEIDAFKPGWHSYLPATAGAKAPLVTNLFAVLGARPFLIKVDPDRHSAPQQFSVTGVPVNRAIRWLPDSYNLTGFAVDTTLALAPTFAEFLDIPSDSFPSIYQLKADGSWLSLSKNMPIDAGRAYWVFNDGKFDRTWPFEINPTSLREMDFMDSLSVRQFSITNLTDQTLSPSITLADSFPLVYYAGDDEDTGAQQWLDISLLSPSLQPGQIKTFDLGVTRSQLNGAADSVVTLRANGAEIHIPVRAEPEPDKFGLYVGSVTIQEVSVVNSSTDTTSTRPVKYQLPFRLMLHYGADEKIRLLKTVYLMAEKAPLEDEQGDPLILNGEQVFGVGELVLVTDETLLANYRPIQQAKGVAQGYRLSSPIYDFPESEKLLENCPQQIIPNGGSCTLSLSISQDSPTNPLRHRYHPFHDGKILVNNVVTPEADFTEAELPSHKREVWTVERELTITLDPQSEDRFAALDDLSGTYLETVKGMHRRDIHIKGTLRLNRVINVPTIVGTATN